MPAELTTTSYAILGLLAVRPWTTYELAQQMDRALGQFWPRAESKLYEEPKKLVAHGLARARSESVGRRPRTVYSITAKGRRTLAAWIPTTGAGPVLEFDELIKVFFAEHGTKDDLLATIERVHAWVEGRMVAGVDVAGGYVRGEGPFPERLPWLILVGRFLEEYVQAVARWADWAQATVESWPEDLARAKPDWAALEQMAADDEAYVRRRREGREPAS
jgi:PadR family transcriptional regulator, regulatory protein AphA